MKMTSNLTLKHFGAGLLSVLKFATESESNHFCTYVPVFVFICTVASSPVNWRDLTRWNIFWTDYLAEFFHPTNLSILLVASSTWKTFSFFPKASSSSFKTSITTSFVMYQSSHRSYHGTHGLVFINIVAFVEKSPLLNILMSTLSKFIPQQRSMDVVSVGKQKNS